jgi:hypothetical protein
VLEIIKRIDHFDFCTRGEKVEVGGRGVNRSGGLRRPTARNPILLDSRLDLPVAVDNVQAGQNSNASGYLPTGTNNLEDFTNPVI